MNRRQIFCPHICTDEAQNDTYTPSILMQMLTDSGGNNITIKKLSHASDKYMKIIPRKLGKLNLKLKEEAKLKGKGTREKPYIITPKDVLDFKVREHDL